MTRIAIKVEDIREGDEFWDGGRHFWTALAPSESASDDVNGEHVRVEVVHRDGGRDVRGWLPGSTIEILRDEAQ